MRGLSAGSLVLGTMLVMGVAPAAANPVITNGSFEAVQISGDTCANLAFGCSTNPADWPGWTHTGDVGDGLLWHQGFVCCGGTNSGKAADGTQWVTMGGGVGVGGTSAWSQTVNGLTVGHSYTIHFSIATEGQTVPTVDVGVSNSLTPSQSFSAGAGLGQFFWQVWQPEQYTFIPDATSSVLTFSVTNQAFDVGLDAVSITSQVPEPGTGSMMLFGSVLIAMGVMRGKSARKAF